MLTKEQQAARGAAINAGLNPNTLKPFMSGWETPSPDDIGIAIELAGVSTTKLGELMGVDNSNVRRWKRGDRKISFAPWCLLLIIAGMGEIWKESGPLPAKKAQPVTVSHLHQARDLAKRHRAENPEHAAGLVVVYAGEVAGWMDGIRSPEHWCPNSIGVNAADEVWLALGGNDNDGAERWEPLQ